MSFGLNVIGFVSGNLGLGVSARSYITLLLERGFPIAVYDVDPGLGRWKHDTRFDAISVKTPQELPYPINLFICDAVSLAELLVEQEFLVHNEKRVNVGLIFWELTALSEPMKRSLETLDAVLCASRFIRDVMTSNLSGVTTMAAPHPLYMPTSIATKRERWNLPSKQIVFLSSFDPYSDPNRKNPLAAIEAFNRAFGDTDQACLVFKLNNAAKNGRLHPVVKEISAKRHDRSNIHVLAQNVSYQEVLSLYAGTDVFVSLHRSEGLGLGLMEAMALGKPVIATSWSGNMSYMNRNNSCLIGSRQVPVQASMEVYSKSYLGTQAFWAEPDIDEAAAWMKRLAFEPTLRSTIGKTASEDMLAYHEEARKGKFVDEIVGLLERPASLAARLERKRENLEWLRQRIIAERSRAQRRPTALRRAVRTAKRVLDRHLLWRINKHAAERRGFRD